MFEGDEGPGRPTGVGPEDVSSVTHSVAYDRAGLGWSEAGPPPRDAETVARELHQRSPGSRPVSPSSWSVTERRHIHQAYAHRYPFETAGIVLVDPLHDGFIDRLQREQLPTATFHRR